jgi:UMF1 family MFS transporter
VVLVLPMFLFVPDRPRLRRPAAALRAGMAEVHRTLRALGGGSNVSLYLLAHLIYADGLVALFAFAGIYATGIFGWGVFQVGLFGILATVTGVIGALIGGWLDDRLGAKTVVVGSLIGLIATIVVILSISSDHIFFVFAVAPPMPGQMFASTGEQLYLVLGGIVGALAGPIQAASRTLLVRLSPADKVTEYFGLYALSSRITSFIGPLAVGALTAWTANQRVGMSALVVILAAGAALLALVKVPKATSP